MAKPRILFVCDGDASRSLMARGFAQYYAGQRIEADSSALNPQPPSDYILWGMNEAGIDLSQERATALAAARRESFDYVVRIVDANSASLPPLKARTSLEDWLVTDPSRVRGEAPDVIKTVRLIRYQIETRVHDLLKRILSPK